MSIAPRSLSSRAARAKPSPAIDTIDPDASEADASNDSEAGALTSPDAAKRETEPVAASAAVPIDATGRWVVQAGAFFSRETSDRIATQIDGFVEAAGRLWRVRSGPYANRGQADAALAMVRGAGYRAAQVYSIR